MTAGVNIPGVWNAATYGIHPPPFYASFPLGASSTSANIASVNVADGTTEAAMLAIANTQQGKR